MNIIEIMQRQTEAKIKTKTKVEARAKTKVEARAKTKVEAKARTKAKVKTNANINCHESEPASLIKQVTERFEPPEILKKLIMAKRMAMSQSKIKPVPSVRIIELLQESYMVEKAMKYKTFFSKGFNRECHLNIINDNDSNGVFCVNPIKHKEYFTKNRIGLKVLKNINTKECMTLSKIHFSQGVKNIFNLKAGLKVDSYQHMQKFLLFGIWLYLDQLIDRRSLYLNDVVFHGKNDSTYDDFCKHFFTMLDNLVKKQIKKRLALKNGFLEIKKVASGNEVKMLNRLLYAIYLGMKENQLIQAFKGSEQITNFFNKIHNMDFNPGLAFIKDDFFFEKLDQVVYYFASRYTYSNKCVYYF